MGDSIVRVGGNDDEKLPTRADEKAADKMSMTNARAAAALRVKGVPIEEITEILGYVSEGVARAAIERALAATVDPLTDFAALKRLIGSRYEVLWAGIANKALNATLEIEVEETLDDNHTALVKKKVPNEEHLAAAAIGLRIVESMARYYGANAPQEVTLRHPEVREFEELVSRLAIATSGAPTQEANVFEEDSDGVYRQKSADDAA